MKWKTILLTMISVAALTNCGAMENNGRIPERPRISASYQKQLMTAGPETAKAAMEHEWDWHGYADKMENRIK